MKILAALLLIVSAPAFAEGPCVKDRETFCPGMKFGPGLLMCLKKHEDKLSAECLAHRDEVKEKIGDLKSACEADAAKLCPDAKGRARVKCLMEKKAQVSAACIAEWNKMKDAKKALRAK
jgi:hypothetical protein